MPFTDPDKKNGHVPRIHICRVAFFSERKTAILLGFGWSGKNGVGYARVQIRNKAPDYVNYP